jgi:nucleoside-triphosphatase
LTNLLISGLPRSGKTTLVRRLLEQNILKNKAGGFFTEEIRERAERVGFMIHTIPEEKRALLASKDFLSRFRVGSYGVNTNALEDLGCKSIEKSLKMKNIVIIDEIGKMELYSDRFRMVLLEALNSPHKVLATIMERPNPFTDRIKNRTDVKLFSLNRKNFASVFEKSKEWIEQP